MTKTSTLIYSIHNIGSKATIDLTSAENLFFKDEFADVYAELDTSKLEDVKQSVVDNILNVSSLL